VDQQRDVPTTLDRSGYELEVEDTFAGTELDRSLWLPWYLPHWSSRAASAARYRLGDGALRLVVEEDQPPWCPEFDGQVRVSNLQTGVFAGPLGSPVGQHRFRPGLVVREEQEERRLYTPRYGLVEVRARFSDDPAAMGALWLIGFEDAPERSAEICVVEVFGRDVGEGRTAVGMGVHPFGDPRLTDDFVRPELPVDARGFHDYAVEWTPSDVAFYVDEQLVHVVRQSPDYPVQVMLDVYALPGPEGGPPPGPWPKQLSIEWFRGWRATA
jgi:Glycosyl hydrolases family 16